MQEISNIPHTFEVLFIQERVVKERLNYKILHILHCIIVRCVEGWSSPTLCTSCYGEIKKKKKKKRMFSYVNCIYLSISRAFIFANISENKVLANNSAFTVSFFSLCVCDRETKGLRPDT